MAEDRLILHASSIALNEKGLLITGRSGSGKSGLALALMSAGAGLVSDDRTCLQVRGNDVWMSAPETIRGLIEARGIGILRADPVPAARICAVVDLDTEEAERLPAERRIELLGVSLPLLSSVNSRYFPAGLIQYLKGGRHA